jgi:hypothetical protein
MFLELLATKFGKIFFLNELLKEVSYLRNLVMTRGLGLHMKSTTSVTAYIIVVEKIKDVKNGSVLLEQRSSYAKA